MTIIDGTVESSDLIFPAKGLKTRLQFRSCPSLHNRCGVESYAGVQRVSVETFPGRKQLATEHATRGS